MATTIHNLFGVNIGSPYLLAFMLDGSAYAFNVDTLALTQIAIPGTFGQIQDLTIWQGSTVLIVDTATGYFQWQLAIGAPLTTEGISGNVDPGLHSWVVTFVSGSGETNPGTNSIPLNVIGGSPPVGSQVNLTAVPLGPTGTTARKIYRTVAGNVGNFLLVGTIADNTTTAFTDNVADSSLGAAAAGVGQITLISAEKIGSTIATYAGRVWISIRRVTSFTAPNSTTDFSVVNAGGSFVMTDSSFTGDIKKDWASLDTLWVFGEASINQISNVNVGTGNITTFNNTNISSSIGTIFPRSVLTYLRNQFFATSFGIYSNTGFTPNRLSSDIDGTIAQIDFDRAVVSCLGIHNEIIVFLVFCFYRDPRLCVTRPVFLTYFQSTSSNEQGNQKWYISSQGDDLTTVAYLESNGRYRVFGTDGNKIYELFTTPGIHHRLESPLAELDDIATTKEFNRLRATVAVGREVLNIDVTPVTETGPHPLTEYPPRRSNEMRFVSDEGKFFFFYADVGSPPIDPCDVPPEDFIHVFPGTTCEIAETPGFLMASWQISNYGVMVGFDLDFDNDPFIVTAYCMEIVQRDQWGDAGNG
jgi:hypothetical protein